MPGGTVLTECLPYERQRVDAFMLVASGQADDMGIGKQGLQLALTQQGKTMLAAVAVAKQKHLILGIGTGDFIEPGMQLLLIADGCYGAHGIWKKLK